MGFVYLQGGIPGHKRKELINSFHDNADIRIFLSTDAGGTGLNLQNASTVINMDLPWNPAVLDQRIGRIHRIGQHRPVRVINFVSEGTIEHGMLDVLSFKKSVFAGVLDSGEDTVFMGETRLNKLMKSVETVTQEIPETTHEPPPNTPMEIETEAVEGGPQVPQEPTLTPSLEPLLRAGASFLKELGAFVSETREPGKSPAASLLDKDEKTGRTYLKIPMPDPKIIEDIISAIGPFLDRFKAESENTRQI